MEDIDYSKIPEHMRAGMKKYVENGILGGDFQYAVLTNNFVLVCCMADSVNKENLFEWAYFLCNELPIECWGSEKKVHEWVRKKKKENKD